VTARLDWSRWLGTLLLALLAAPKRSSRQAQKRVIRKIEVPNGVPLQVLEGRFGPYVTDGETNASLRRGDSVDAIDHERAVELIADRRARGPAAKAVRKAPAKKAAPRKKAPAKRAAPAKAPAGKA